MKSASLLLDENVEQFSTVRKAQGLVAELACIGDLTFWSCMPHMRPRPLISSTSALSPTALRSDDLKCSPFSVTDRRKSGSDKISKVTCAVWQTRGLPANVLPWSPGEIVLAICSFSRTAPIGSPPADQNPTLQVSTKILTASVRALVSHVVPRLARNLYFPVFPEFVRLHFR